MICDSILKLRIAVSGCHNDGDALFDFAESLPVTVT